MSSPPGWHAGNTSLSSYAQVAGRGTAPASYRPPARPPAPERVVSAPTLGQYWRSDSRVIPGRPRPKWAGRAAFWLGLFALGAYLYDFFFVGTPSLGVGIAQPVGVVAFFFALIAIIAGVGRGLGVFGLIFAVLSNLWFWGWISLLVFGAR